MNVLVIGGGGREHALVHALARDSCRPRLFCAPGNAGTAERATNVPISAEDVSGLLRWASQNRPDLTVVGPEAPLCAGLVDAFEAAGLRVFGPTRAAAQLEGSKAFSKDVMTAAGVPTAAARVFTEVAPAMAFARTLGAPVVIKADGLAAGKGVSVCASLEEAERAIRQSLVERVFGDSGRQVLVEEFLEGEEASILALVDGERVALLASAQDHKRVFDQDQGPNTGGMGAYSPAPVVTEGLLPAITELVFQRTLRELRTRGIVYRGVLYAGLMIGRSGFKVLEFNCRFGDPETQVILPRLASDLIPALVACAEGRLEPTLLRWRREPCVCVVMAAGGYPGPYQKGQPITGLREANALRDVVVFHAGTAQKDGAVVTAGGRVLGVTALGPTLRGAVDQAYAAVAKIRFEGAHSRRDIAARALARSTP
jgi:phosphoribosylamine--glycine ligase